MQDNRGGQTGPGPDLTAGQPGSVQDCVQSVVEREGRIDAVVNCVNEMMIGSIEEPSVDEVDQPTTSPLSFSAVAWLSLPPRVPRSTTRGSSPR